MSYQEYKQKKRQESDRQAQLSYGELFNLNSKKAALMAFWQVALTYFIFTFLIKDDIPMNFLMFFLIAWFIGSFAYETFGCKLKSWLRRAF